MRHAFKNSDEATHVWAQQTQDSGYSSNVKFEGKSIYSYGSHFEMARFVDKNVVFVTTRTYSVTTAKHLGGVRQAISHLKSFEVPTFDDHKANALAYVTDLTHDLYTISRMRSDPEWNLKQYKAKAKEAAEYVALYKSKVGAKLYREVMDIFKKADNPLTAEQVAKFKVQPAKDREKAKAETAKRAALRAAELAELQKTIDDWARGEDVRGRFHDMPVRLRVKDNEIQTSRGANVPLIEARKLWHALQAKQSVEGMRVGHYTVTAIRDGALIVGCHTIPLREVYKMAKALNWGTFEMEVA